MIPLLAFAIMGARLAPVNAECTPVSGGTAVPVEYSAHRWLFTPALESGARLRFYLDTGGGANMLYEPAVARLGLLTTREGEGANAMTLAPAPRFSGGRTTPAIPSMGEGPPRVLVPPAAASSQLDTGVELDGFLGRVWFADRIWTFDYPARRLLLLEAADLAKVPVGCALALGFQTDSTGQRTTNFPRIQAEIDGETLDLLFDTGATTSLTDSALAAVADGEPAARATSFITRTIVERWKSRHPDWAVIDRAERGTGARMIQVPAVMMGGVVVGPVWFTERPDRNFHEYMSQWMD
ncbi:MAG: hypothetical protein ABI647_26030, partial [Gemmatimonadota bacterium]